ncbi:hypothetical protein [Mesorhizobium sp.]|uniref:hypothetical protein n=1 Tax=Mesorhizobium sp. TaxID=1871066 RepID=UPI000FE37345|nr:hypothetical protein [Mesorhizobium sp.]RWJ03431.1 MAG: hypothetical protein EOR24_32130 [Mesorhizobium sp.]
MNAPNHMNMLHGKEIKLEERCMVDRFGRKRVGNYMATSSGRKYWPFDPRPDEIDIEVIAHHLANTARWAGATQHKRFKSRIFLSVAEHSVLVARYLAEVLKRPDLALEGLLHDGTEGYIGDLIRPLKYSPEFRKPFLEVELLNETPLGSRFNLVYPFPKEVKIADEAVTSAEQEQCIFWHPDEQFEPGHLHDHTNVAPYQIEMLEPYPAKELFLMAYWAIMADREKYRPLPEAFRV